MWGRYNMNVRKELGKRKGIFFVFFGILFIFSALQYNQDNVIMTGLIAAGVVFLIRGIKLIFSKEKKIQRDERTIMIGGRAASYSWFLTLMIVNFIFWIDYLKLYLFSVRDVIVIVLFSLILGFLIFKWGFEKKGDF